MKSLCGCLLILISFASFSQSRIYPLIKNYGGVFDIPYAEEKPDPSLDYNIVIEVEHAIDSPDSLNWALNNVARLLNVHAIGGVRPERLHVVLAIHGGAAYSVLNNEAYQAKYKVSNPNLRLFEELEKAGVKMFVCGQSLIARKIDRMKMVTQVKIASSMLTTLTTYQLRGYAVLKF
ncbi:MAG TPA: DsrE family protein [Cyclobacteriaceae bacterium]|nr:DsrE family protein [Cyclobacteriaceae bacterium]